MSLVGRIEDLSLSDIFQILSIGKKTGTLILKGKSGNAVIVFKNGFVVRAETDTLDKNLGEDLIHAGIVKESIYYLVSAVQKKLPGKPISEIFFEFGALSKDSLEKITKKRIEKVISNLLQWQEGDFQFEPDDVNPVGKVNLSDPGWELSKGLSPEYLLLEGARMYDESYVSADELRGDITEESTEESTPEEEWGESWETPRVVERKDISSLRALSRELRFPDSSSEINLLILRFASGIFERGVLFMVGKNAITGFGQFGLTIERPDEKIRTFVLPLHESPFLKKIIREKQPYKGAIEKDKVIEALINNIGGGWPRHTAFFPVIAEGKVFALLYCDNLSTGESVSKTEELEIFIDQAGLALEKLLLQAKLQEMKKKAEPP
ncbi:MAG: DUF4388 domain-containing protein [Nitrospira sp.]|nr:DUF4388 domain-containing protein [Nitrospira sp.]